MKWLNSHIRNTTRRRTHRKTFSISNIEITPREILFSLIIIALLLVAGFFIADAIREYHNERAEIYVKALPIDNAEHFTHGLKTSVGNAIVEGEFSAVDPVSVPELGAEFFALEKITERYVMKTRTVTYTDSDGKTQTRVETYWEWDRVNTQNYQCSEFSLLGFVFTSEKLNIDPALRLDLDGIAAGRHTGGYLYTATDERHYYYYLPTTFNATILTNLQANDLQGRSSINYEMSISEVVEEAKSAGDFWIVAFWIAWGILIAGAVVAFVYLDNKWLETHK